MSRSSCIDRLAKKLARMSAGLQERHGELLAQKVPLALLLRRWEAGLDVTSLLDGFDDADALDYIEKELDGAELDETLKVFEDSGRDPVVYFYAHYLKAYNPAEQRGRGVIYTPPEVVACIVNVVESILQDCFDETLDDAAIIDPCCGVGTFLRHIERRGCEPKRLVGFELMPAPCAIARCLLHKSEVIQADWLSERKFDFGRYTPVILGNPPYSGHSSNVGRIADLMRDYRRSMGEQNPKWLQDDYVKFIRMAQHHIECAGRGVVAFITNHSYLFNPTFRVMRQSLMSTFDDIRIVDLGGNLKRQGVFDENVFPIQIGVAIAFLTRTGAEESSVKYLSINGSREQKLRAVRSLNVREADWREAPAIEPFHLFVPQDGGLARQYYDFPSVLDLFRKSTIGFVSSRDSFAVGFSRQEVLKRVAALREGIVSDEVLRDEYGVGGLDIAHARDLLRNDPSWENRAVEVLYRPFDRRWAYHSPIIMERPRWPMMQTISFENPALAIGRAGQVTGSDEWDVVFCADMPTDLNLFRRGGAKLFPKYLYENGERISNVMPGYFDEDTLIGYVYAILHSRRYRTRYDEFLKVDYPRIPMLEDQVVVRELAKIGQELMWVHLMRDDEECEISDDLQVRIGGYLLPDRYIKSRAGVDSEQQVARVKRWLCRMSSLRGRIDKVIAGAGIWS
ncbi:MAG: type ISP restriction/modification enzyme [Armatimonadota bacterium]|jgi:predicted helicase